MPLANLLRRFGSESQLWRAVSQRAGGLPRWKCLTNSRENAEDDIHFVRFQIKSLKTAFLHNVIEADVSGFSAHPLAEDILDPKNVLFELGITNPREPYPYLAFSHRQQPATPTEESLLPIDLFQINGFIHFQGVPICDNYSPIHRSEIDSIATDQTIMGRLYRDIDPLGTTIRTIASSRCRSR